MEQDLAAQIAKNTRELEALKSAQAISSQNVVPTYTYSATRRYNSGGAGIAYKPKITFTTNSGDAGIVSFFVNLKESNGIFTPAPNILPGYRIGYPEDGKAGWFIYEVVAQNSGEYIVIEVDVVSSEPGTLTLGEY